MNSPINRIRSSEFLKNVLTLTTGTTIAQALPILISPILTRLYSPSDFGLLALFTSLVTVLSTIATGKYELGILLPGKNKRALQLSRLSILLTFFCSVLLLLIILIAHQPFLWLLQDKRIGFWLYIIPAAVLLTGLYEILRYYSIRQKAYRAISESAVIRSGTASAIQIGTGLFIYGSYGLLWGYLISLITGNLRLWKIVKKDAQRDRAGFFEIKKLKGVAGRYAGFPKFTMPSLFLNTASVQMPVFVFSTFFSGVVVGFYSLAQRVLNAPMSLIGNAIGQVYFQKAASCKNDPEALRSITWKLYKTLLWTGVFPLSMLGFFGKEIFGFIFGREWAVAGHYAQMLSFWILFVFISSPLSNLFFIQEKQKQGLVLQAIIFSSRFIVLLGCIVMQINAADTVLAFGITGAILFFCFIYYLLASVGIPKLKIFYYTILVICAGIIPFYLLKIILWG